MADVLKLDSTDNLLLDSGTDNLLLEEAAAAAGGLGYRPLLLHGVGASLLIGILSWLIM